MARFKTLADLEPGGRVLVRLDLNSPVEDGAVQDNRRFERHAETLDALLADGHAVVCMAHQGRPGRETFVSLAEHADILASHLGRDVAFVEDTCGDAALEAVESLDAGEVLMLENVRMCEDELPERPAEDHADSAFVRALSPAVDAYVNDAYSAAHRAHASLVGFAETLPSYAGLVMEAEYGANTSIATREFDGDVTMVVGGTKVTDVVEVMEALGDRVDTFLLGGIAGELFLRADGHPVGRDVGGSDRFDDQWAENRDTVEALLAERRDAIRLPTDLAVEDEHGERAEVNVADVDEKTTDFLDVGHRTTADYRPVIRDSAAVFVKGALGLFEDERFSYGTVSVLDAVAETDCFSVVGGGDTSRAVGMYGLDGADFSHVSIAGGAYIRALTGEPLAAVEALERAAERMDAGD
jgi:phosphoglycerate kinase